ncbi:hypothetical protein Tco_1382143 [Tanacetum coccineum]
MGTSIINIVDKTLDSSSNIDVNNVMEKVKDSVGENSLVDLNDLNELNATINDLKINVVHPSNSKENVDVEKDINKAYPYSKIGTSLDLSRPPSFEHMKRTSSKCSISFSRYRKKDIKLVSLIEELSRIIKVGDSLGFDVRACRLTLKK